MDGYPTLHVDLAGGSTQEVPLSADLVERYNGDWDVLYSELSPTIRLLLIGDADVVNFWMEQP